MENNNEMTMSINKIYNLLLVEKEKNNIIGEITFDVDVITYNYSRLDTHTDVDDIYETDLAQIEHVLYENDIDDEIIIDEPDMDEDCVTFSIYM